jgi:hypothetical protein
MSATEAGLVNQPGGIPLVLIHELKRSVLSWREPDDAEASQKET